MLPSLMSDPPDLPEKHPSHELSAESRRKFAALVPAPHSLHKVDESADYGIDYILEEFRMGHPTGRLVPLQLRSVEEAEFVDGKPVLDMQVPTLTYLLQFPIPTLVVLWDKDSGRFYVNRIQTTLVDMTRREGAGWMQQGAKRIRFDPIETIEEPEDLSRLLASLPQQTDEGLRRAWEAARSFDASLIAAVLDAIEPNGQSPKELIATVRDELGNGASGSTIEDLIKQLPDGVVEVSDGKLLLGGPRLEAVLQLIPVIGDQVIELIRKGGWIEHLPSDLLGRALGSAVAQGLLSPEVLDELRTLERESYFAGLEAVVFLNPHLSTKIPGLQTTVQRNRQSEGMPDAIHHIVGFTDEGLAREFGNFLDTGENEWVELVSRGDTAYLVLLEGRDQGDPQAASMQSIQSDGEDPFAINVRAAGKPTAVTVKGTIAQRHEELPFLIAGYSYPVTGVPEVRIAERPFEVAPGQTMGAKVREDGHSWMVILDGVPFLQVLHGVDLEDELSDEMLRQLRDKEPDFGIPTEIAIHPQLVRRAPPPWVVEELEGRYEKVRVENPP